MEVTSVVEGEGVEDEHNRERDEASGSDGDVIDKDIEKKGPKKGKKQPKKEPKVRIITFVQWSVITFVQIALHSCIFSRRIRHAKCARHFCKRQSRMGEVSKGNGGKGQSGQWVCICARMMVIRSGCLG